eukprot:TRINITY_DN2424_c0_g1_i9.p3 TRINITY_DN2424_c0_g1~~TRINITY_DN2424_c0_g1_i9.p3  ORF type:complete len:133 (-),score=44.96 TRINITY_DN2424_c0_g1_i9:440-838(-)
MPDLRTSGSGSQASTSETSVQASVTETARAAASVDPAPAAPAAAPADAPDAPADAPAAPENTQVTIPEPAVHSTKRKRAIRQPPKDRVNPRPTSAKLVQSDRGIGKKSRANLVKNRSFPNVSNVQRLNEFAS